MKQFLKDNRGFTLIEVLAVIIILGILLAIAGAVFLGQRQKADAVNSKQALTNTAKSVTSDFLSNDSALPVGATLVANATADNPGYTFAANNNCAVGIVGINRINANLVEFCTATTQGERVGYTLDLEGNRNNTRRARIGRTGANYTNLVINPSFESTWSSNYVPAGPSPTEVSNGSTSGDNALRFQGVGQFSSGIYQAIPVTIGQRYYAQVTTTVNQGQVALVATNPAATIWHAFATSSGTGKQTIEIEFVAPDANFLIWIINNGAGSNDYVVDDLMVTAINTAGLKIAYFDGDYPNATWTTPALRPATTSITNWPGRPW